MAVAYDPLEEGNPFSVTDIDTTLADAVSNVNNLTPQDIRPHSLHHYHVEGHDAVDDVSPSPGISISLETGADHAYTAYYPGWNTSTMAPGALSTGWAIIGGSLSSLATPTPLTITWGSINLSSGAVKAVEVELDCELRHTSTAGDVNVVIALMYFNGSSWVIIPGSERKLSRQSFASSYSDQNRDMPTSWLITEDDVTTLAGVQAVVSLQGGANPDTFTLRGAALNCLFLRGPVY